MRVKLIKDVLDFKKGTEFEVDNQDDGFYTYHAFFQGWVVDKNGHKSYSSFDQDDCKRIYD